MPKKTPEMISANMKAVKSSGSKIERVLGSALHKKGIRFRKNVKDVFGKPDFAVKKYKIAVFCDSEFWHGKNWEKKKLEFKSNKEFWHKKISRNIERDKEVSKYLSEKGWKVFRFWGEEILKNADNCAAEVKKYMDSIKNAK